MDEANAAARRAHDEMQGALGNARAAAEARQKENNRIRMIEAIQAAQQKIGTAAEPYLAFRAQAEKYRFSFCPNTELSGTSLYIGRATHTFEDCAQACAADALCGGFDVQANGTGCAILKGARVQGPKPGRMAGLRGGC
jgi:hypothetical protein